MTQEKTKKIPYGRKNGPPKDNFLQDLRNTEGELQ